MIDASRQDEQVARLGSNANPLVLRITDVEVPRSFQDVSNLLIFVHVFVVEHFDPVLVDGAHGAGGNGYLVAVGIAASFGEVLDLDC